MFEIVVCVLILIYVELRNQTSLHGEGYSYTLIVALVFSVFKAILTCFKHMAEFKYQKAKIYRHQTESYWSTSLSRKLFIEISICALIPLPFVDGTVYYLELTNQQYGISFRYSYNDCMLFFSFARLIYSLQYLEKLYFYGNNSSKRVCSFYNCKGDVFFTLRCLIQEYSISFVLITEVFLIVSFAYFIRICEFQNPRYDFTNYYNCCWFTMVTMATIGYGDYLPLSPVGRIVTFTVAVCGIIQANLIVVIVSGHLKLQDREVKALNAYEQLRMRKTIVKDLMKIMLLAYKLKKALVLHETVFSKLIIRHYFNQMCKCNRGLIEMKKRFESEKLRETDQFTRNLELNIKKAQFIEQSVSTLRVFFDDLKYTF